MIMTEAEWLACTDLQKMLEFVQGKASERKLPLFFCACCRGKQYPVCPQGLAGLAVAEAFADGLTDETVRADAERRIESLLDGGNGSAYSLIAWALHRLKDGSHPLKYVMMWIIPAVVDVKLASSDEITSVLRDIFGPLPFRPVAIGPTWLTWNDGTVPRIAQAIYDERAFDRMPVLADALEDAGCTEQSILDHCRQPGEHVRGCWVVDLLTGRE
jgi:hypothetical protein